MFNRVVWWVTSVSATAMWVLLPIALTLVDRWETREIGLILTLLSALSSIVFSIGILISIHQGWSALTTHNDAEDTPFRQMRSSNIGPMQAVAYLFIPIFNTYWQFVVLAGWCKQVRLRREAVDTNVTAPPVGIAVFAIVASWIAGALLPIMPAFGIPLGIASTAAWLTVAHAMLTWGVPSARPSSARGLAYFGLVDGKIDVRILVGTVAAIAFGGIVSSAANQSLMPLVYGEYAQAMSGTTRVFRTLLYVSLVTPIVVGAPAAAGKLLDIRSPWLLVPIVIPAGLASSALVHLAFGVLEGDLMPSVSTFSYALSYSIERAIAATAVVALLYTIRPALIAMTAGLATVSILHIPFANIQADILYALTSENGELTVYSFWYPISKPNYVSGTEMLQFGVIGLCLWILHTVIQSPLVRAEAPSPTV